MRQPKGWPFSLLGWILLLGGPEAFAQDKAEGTRQPVPPYEQPEKHPPPATAGVGVLEVPRPGGGKDKIYYSTITREEEAQRKEEEKEKNDRSWEILRNVIIDKRSR